MHQPYIKFTVRLMTIVVVSSMSFLGCGSAQQLSSSWNDSNVIVDGSQTDWGNETVYLKDEGLALGVKNDQDFLYVCIISQDRRLPFQLAFSGFTLWVQPVGNEGKTFGIHFPLGAQGTRTSRREDSLGDNDIQNMLRSIPPELEIIGPGKEDKVRLLAMEARGIEVQLAERGGVFVYEAKIPLEKSADHQFAIGIGEATSVEVGLKTGGLDWRVLRTQRMSDRGEMPEGTDPPSGTTRRGRPPGGRPGPSEGSRPRPLDVWVEVQLASGGTSTAK